MTNKTLSADLSAQRPRLHGITPLKLTAKQTQSWDMTRSALLWNCPAFTHILYTMMATPNGDVALFTDKIPTAATDGSTMLINPEWFFALPLPQRVFVATHEILHAVWDHCGQGHMHKKRGFVLTSGGKKLDYDPKLMNQATDLVINDLLVESKIGIMPKVGWHDTNYATHTDSAVDVYEKLHKEAEKNGKTPFEGEGFDVHLEPGEGNGQSAEQAQSNRSPIEWETAVAAGMASAKAQGKLPGAMERMFLQILEPEVSWQEKIQAFFNRKVGSGSYDWRRPDRALIVRDVYAPGRSGFGAGTIVVAVDTSGSVGQAELDVFFAEMRGILGDVRPKQMFVLWIDSHLHKVDEISEAEDVGGLKPAGGGGTCFRPAFEWIAEQGIEPDALVYLTDGMGSFPDAAPAYPVLWGAIYPGITYPFGEVIDIPLKSRD